MPSSTYPTRSLTLLIVIALISGACDSGSGSQMENAPPTANPISYPASTNAKLKIGAPGVLKNDTDPDGDDLTVASSPVKSPTNGSLTLNTDGSFTYTSEQDFTGEDSFTYEVADGNGNTDQATATITVKSVEYSADVQPIFDGSCGGGDCHIEQRTSGVRLTSKEAVLNSEGSQYETLIVEPGDGTPSASPLVEKILPNPPIGQRMPAEGLALSEESISTIRAWIESLDPQK